MSACENFRKAQLLGLAALLLPFIFGGCGGDSRSGDHSGERGNLPVLEVAAGAKPSTVDPLTTETDDGLELSRQIHEPLVMAVKAPRSQRRLNGLVLSWKKSRDSRVWLAWLRTGVYFQDGTKLDARAAVANARRWIATAAGRAQISVLRKATSPRSGLVRFSLTGPIRDLPHLLASPRLGLVSPSALSRLNGRGSTLKRATRTGTGPFELRSGELGHRTTLQQNPRWWARKRGISLAVGKVVFEWQPDQIARIKQVKSADVSIATGITQVGVDRLAGDPNVQLLGRLAVREYAAVRWLRGVSLSPRGAESLASAWLTQTR